jgi:hypothetical protein
VSKVPVEALSENLLMFVSALSEDVASVNAECSVWFLEDFFNAYNYVERQCKPVCLHFVRPILAREID